MNNNNLIIINQQFQTEFNQNLIQNYQNLLKSNQNYSDITIKIGYNLKEFYCHKSILSCQSPFFSLYLKENQINEIIFKEINEEDMNQIIQYIYTGNIQLNQSNLFSIWLISIKFQLQSLQNFIENEIIIKNFNQQYFLPIF
ncbi:kelch-like protein 24 isoform x1 [Anaeramoeba ignava]|uniref:Kelch-like protein 24 isoform x1 n=1 Tax=Anaeramoeba ignava TaxID=1746090 RepID=A0A9Q0LFZ6_ANAIG|nr:kelch-like protein 24 isoform x1 [Anaeramoeba ignava]